MPLALLDSAKAAAEGAGQVFEHQRAERAGRFDVVRGIVEFTANDKDLRDLAIGMTGVRIRWRSEKERVPGQRDGGSTRTATLNNTKLQMSYATCMCNILAPSPTVHPHC